MITTSNGQNPMTIGASNAIVVTTQVITEEDQCAGITTRDLRNEKIVIELVV